METKSSDKPLYAYVPPEVHTFADYVKELTGLSKSDFVWLLVSFAEGFSDEKLKLLADTFLIEGPGGVKALAQNEE